MANDEFSVRSIVSSNISADLCEIDIVLATEDGLRRVCKINPDVLAELLINLSDLAQHVRNQIVARFGELTIAALGVDAVAASSPTGSGKIIMSIQRGGTCIIFPSIQSYPRFFDLKCETRKDLRKAILRMSLQRQRALPARCNQSGSRLQVRSGERKLPGQLRGPLRPKRLRRLASTNSSVTAGRFLFGHQHTDVIKFNVPLDKGEVESSILSRSASPIFLTFCARRYTSVKPQFLRWIDLQQ